MATTTTFTEIGLEWATANCPGARQPNMQINAQSLIDCDGKWESREQDQVPEAYSQPRRLLLRRLKASSSRCATGKMHEMLIGAGGAHGTETPVSGAGRHVRKPILGIMRRGAVRIFGAKALAGRRRPLVGSDAHRG